ncbi:hypothetical protein SLA_3737 [Streptomyces laurentii]|uniref:Transmembrane protein n=1 Tax=Streptomyces laurentii TaxID=39478 RepID=A0A169NMV5_STRLU|nr:hypothetical protein SLA_3737 [Streptomyces laurentii]
MHMHVAPHLLPEDRPAFERILDDALRAVYGLQDPAAAASARPLTIAQLRTRVLDALDPLTATAAVEYDHFVRLREQAREHAREQTRSPQDGRGTDERPLHARGAGLIAVVTVLAPLLAGATAVTLLLVGAVLRLFEPVPAFADTLLTAGLFFGAAAAAGLLCGAAALLVTALRHRAAPAGTADGSAADDETARAEEAWHRALRDRGILPFLHDALAPPPEGPEHPAPDPDRLPRVGYSAPDFTGPDVPDLD